MLIALIFQVMLTRTVVCQEAQVWAFAHLSVILYLVFNIRSLLCLVRFL